MKISEGLRAGERWMAEKGWTQGTAGDRWGPNCLMGAVFYAVDCNDNEYRRCVNFLNDFTMRQYGRVIPSYNDDLCASEDEARGVLLKAADAAEQKEWEEEDARLAAE